MSISLVISDKFLGVPFNSPTDNVHSNKEKA